MIPVADHAAFVAGLRAERQAFHTLCQLLESEQACLIQADAESLLDIARSKSEQVDRLTELARRRVEHLHAMALDQGQAGIEEWLALHAGAQRAELTRLWQELTRFAAQARSLNETNGKLMATRLSHNQAALSALQSAASAQDLYGPDGHAAVVAGQRELGRA